jgi:hypothetical protein
VVVDVEGREPVAGTAGQVGQQRDEQDEDHDLCSSGRFQLLTGSGDRVPLFIGPVELRRSASLRH